MPAYPTPPTVPASATPAKGFHHANSQVNTHSHYFLRISEETEVREDGTVVRKFAYQCTCGEKVE